MSRYRDQVAEALGAVVIHGATQYSWLGRRSRLLPTALERELSNAERRRYLVSSVGEELYFSFYCHGRPVTARWGLPEPVASQLWLLQAMSRANTGHGSWEPGWTVMRVERDHAVVSKSGLRVQVALTGCEGERPSGAVVSLAQPKELPLISPGFWTVLGDAQLDASQPSGLVRVYWNVSSGGAPALVGAVTSLLNGAGVPFRLKLADHPLRFARCDAGVLYVDGDAFPVVQARLAETAAALAEHLRPDVPAFTLELAPGVGLAEENDDASFGARRCALLAEAIVQAHERALTALDERLDLVARRFAEAGVLIDAPYLEPSLAGRHVL